MSDELPSGDKAVYIFLEMIALGFVLAAVETLVAGRPWFVSGLCLALGLVFLIAGVKWPQIKLRAGTGFAASVDRIANHHYRRSFILVVAVLVTVGLSIGVLRIVRLHRFQNAHLRSQSPPPNNSTATATPLGNRTQSSQPPSNATQQSETKTSQKTTVKSGAVKAASQKEKITQKEPQPKQTYKTTAPPGANMDMLASVMAGNPVAATGKQSNAATKSSSPPLPGMIACANGKFVPEHHAEECGASNVTVRYNTFEGGALPPNLSSTYNASINNNVIDGPDPRAPINQPNKLEVKDPGTTFTNNTVRNMDASVSNGASASSNLFEGRPNTGRTLSSVADQLAQFIDSAHKIVAEFLKDDNSQLIGEKEKAWEAEARSILLANLGQRFADRFSNATSTSAVYPQEHNAQGGSVCNLIDAKVTALSTFINQLRAAGN